MKKIIVFLLFFTLMLAPVVSKAAEVGISTQAIEQAQTDTELKTQLIVLIKQLIAILQQQLDQMVAQQNAIDQISQRQIASLPVTPIDTYPPTVKLGVNSPVSGRLRIKDNIVQDYGIMPLGNPLEGKLGYGAWLTKIEFYLDQKLVDSVAFNGGIWEEAIDTTQYSNGQHILSAKAYDMAGNIGSDTQEIEVKN